MKQRCIAALLAICLLLCLAAPGVQAQTLSPMESNNQFAHDYLLYRQYRRPWNWADTVLSYLMCNADGTYTRVEASDDYNIASADRIVTVEDYSAEFALTFQRQMPFELPLFGGFLDGSQYNFLVFGQKNEDDSDEREVVRVVRYSKQWERLDDCRIYGANTYFPFDGGSLRMVEVEGMLYIYTCHEMYLSSDGNHHQANLLFAIRTSDMTLTESKHRVWNIGGGYVSHSFNQFLAQDGTNLVAVDHGDAHLRSVTICRYENSAGQETVDSDPDHVEVLQIPDNPADSGMGYNYTGTQVGALLVTSTHYLVAGTAVAMDETYDPAATQNVFITATPKDQFTTEDTTLTYFTQEAADSTVNVSNPYLLKLSAGRNLLMWNMDETLNYLLVDDAGQAISQVGKMNVTLSDCVPVVKGNTVTWYTTTNSGPAFYVLDLSGGSHTHRYQTVVTAPDCINQGYTTHICTCGDSYVDTYTDPIGHVWGEYYVYTAPTCTDAGQERAPCQRPGCRYARGQYLAPLGHDYVDGVCQRCQLADPDYSGPEQYKLYSVSVSVGNTLGMYFWIPEANVADGDYAVVSKSYADAEAKEVTVPKSQWIRSSGYYLVPFTGIAAKEMMDEVTCTVYHADETQASYPGTSSVRRYVYNQLSTANTELKTLLIDLLNYGAEAQKEFAYDSGNLANKELPEADAACATATIDMEALGHYAVKGEGMYGGTLTLKSSILMNVFFETATVTRDMTAKISYTNYKGSPVSYEITGDQFQAFGTVYLVVNIDTLVAADLATVVNVDIYDGEMLVSHCEYNMAQYCQSTAQIPISVALAKYCQSAKNYLT